MNDSAPVSEEEVARWKGVLKGRYTLEAAAICSRWNVMRLLADRERLEALADKYKWQVRDTCARAEAAEARATRAEAAGREALEQLGKAADQFAFYADEHAKKKTPEADAKARTNHGWALACAKAAGKLRAALSILEAAR